MCIELHLLCIRIDEYGLGYIWICFLIIFSLYVGGDFPVHICKYMFNRFCPIPLPSSPTATLLLITIVTTFLVYVYINTDPQDTIISSSLPVPTHKYSPYMTKIHMGEPSHTVHILESKYLWTSIGNLAVHTWGMPMASYRSSPVHSSVRQPCLYWPKSISGK